MLLQLKLKLKQSDSDADSDADAEGMNGQMMRGFFVVFCRRDACALFLNYTAGIVPLSSLTGKKGTHK